MLMKRLLDLLLEIGGGEGKIKGIVECKLWRLWRNVGCDVPDRHTKMSNIFLVFVFSSLVFEIYKKLLYNIYVR